MDGLFALLGYASLRFADLGSAALSYDALFTGKLSRCFIVAGSTSLLSYAKLGLATLCSARLCCDPLRGNYIISRTLANASRSRAFCAIIISSELILLLASMACFFSLEVRIVMLMLQPFLIALDMLADVMRRA